MKMVACGVLSNVALTHPTDDDDEVDDLKEMLLPLASGSYLP